MAPDSILTSGIRLSSADDAHRPDSVSVIRGFFHNKRVQRRDERRREKAMKKTLMLGAALLLGAFGIRRMLDDEGDEGRYAEGRSTAQR
jgi:hypothetical protein